VAHREEFDGSVLLYLGGTAQDSDAIAAMLLDAGADLEARNEAGYTPLVCACLHRPAAVLPLLRRDANAAAAHRDGSTALHTIGANPEITEAEATAIVNARLAAGAYCTLSSRRTL
jgi:ankyrin repeat protein